MLGGLIKKLFAKKKAENAELISDFNKALYYIETYTKAKDYHNAIMAIRELILKHKTSITYYEQVQRKLYSIEASNIEAVSKSASLKIKKVKWILDIIYKRLSILEKNLIEVEKLKNKAEDIKRSKIEKEKISFRKKEIKDTLKKKDYSKSLVLAKKFVFDYQWNKNALELLKISQKLYDKDKTRQEQDKLKKERIQKTLLEAWITDAKDSQKDIKFLFWQNFKLKLKESKRKSKERNDYIKRIKTLGKLEMLLTKSWSINNINWDDFDKFWKEDVFSLIWWWIMKDIWDFETYGFDFFWKIIWKDKIVWDTFWHFKTLNNKVVFYFWDATWHWIQAWFTVAILSKLFFDYTKNYKILTDLVFKTNNQLKEKIKWKSFITWIFFEWDYAKNEMKMIWAWHPPLLIYRAKEKKIERIIPWWLALWVRNILNVSSIKIKDIPLWDWDIICWYTDWILETKDWLWQMYLLDRLEKSFEKQTNIFQNPEKIYKWIIEDVVEFKWWSDFEDDVSIFIFTRNFNKDLIANKQELEQILKETNSKKSIKEIQIKKRTKEEIIEELKREKIERELKIRLDRLDRLAKIWEYIKLKQEVLLYYREWFAHDKMSYYLEKAIANEQKVTLTKMEEKLQRKYETLMQLYKKWEYDIVIKEAMDVIFKNWKI